MRIKIKNSKFALFVMGRAGRFAAISSYRNHVPSCVEHRDRGYRQNACRLFGQVTVCGLTREGIATHLLVSATAPELRQSNFGYDDQSPP